MLDGSQEDLERRYRDIVHLNNAQIDALNPMTFSECVREINRRETNRVKEAQFDYKTAKKVDELKNGKVCEPCH